MRPNTRPDNAGIGGRIDRNSSTGGKLVFLIFGALTTFERELIRERILAVLTAARARGRNGGRPRKLDVRKVCHGTPYGCA